MKNKSHFQDWVNLFLGIWLFVSPFFGFGAVTSAAAINGYIFGALIVALSCVALLTTYEWEEFLTMTIGVWLMVAPLALGFWDQTSIMLNHFNVGVTLIGVAIWALTMRPLPSIEGHMGHHVH